MTDSEPGSESESDQDSEPGLNTLQKRLVLKTIREYVPENTQNLVYTDIMAQMDQLDSKGFKLPKGYDKSKHDISENEIKLYEQQLQRDKHRDQKKVSQMVNFAAFGLSWFCQFISVDWVKTKYLPETIREALEEGDFEDSIEGVGKYLRGTFVENPVFATTLKFLETVGKAHHREMEEQQEELETKEENRGKRHTTALNKLNRFRQDDKTGKAEPSIKLPTRPNEEVNSTKKPAFDVPDPSERKKTT